MTRASLGAYARSSNIVQRGEPLTEEELQRYLKEVRENSIHDMRSNFATALGKLKETRAVPNLCNAMRTDSVAMVRGDMINALGWIEDRRAVPALREAMKDDPNIKNRCVAAQALADRFDERGTVTATLFDIFTKKDFGKVDWCKVVDYPGLPDSLRTLMIARAPHGLMRAALGSLERMGGDEVIAGLEEALGNPDKDVRDAAKAALDRLRRKEIGGE
jgi:HEAT repeat protein